MLKGYKEYKKINVPWLKSIPSHWDIKRAKGIFFPVNERSQKGKEELLSVSSKYGVIKRKNANVTMFMADSYENYKLCWENDLVINSLWAWQTGLGFSSYHGIISTAYSVFRLKNLDNNCRFLHYLLRGTDYQWELQVRSKGIWRSRYQLSDNSFLDSPIILPPRLEQDQIVRYLDWKLSMINTYINAKKKQIELLKEQKQTIVNEMVTSGGKNWEKIPLRKFLRPVAERNRADLPLLSVVREQGVILRDIDNYEDNHNFIPDDLSNYKVVYAGQFVMNKMKAWQGSYGVSAYDGIVSPAYYVFNLVCDCVDFFHIAIRSRYYINKFAQHSIGIRIGQWDLPIDRIKEISFLLPPLTEQHSVVEYINKQCAFINKLIKVLNSEIVLFTEYRTRLISDVVTGKVDVQGEKVPEFAVENENSPGIRQETEGDIDDE